MLKDKQVGGTHYKQGIQPFEYIRANSLDFFEGNCVKYVTRHRKKNGAEDIKKAIHYLEEILLADYNEVQESENLFLPEEAALKVLIESIPKDRYRRIYSTGRGGMWTAARLGYALNIEEVYVIAKGIHIDIIYPESTLFVDDIADSGETISTWACDTAVLFERHSTKVKPTYSGALILHDEYVKLPISQGE